MNIGKVDALAVMILVLGCSHERADGGSEVRRAGVIEADVPLIAFQQVTGSVLHDVQRGQVEQQSIGVLERAVHGGCAPGVTPCVWETRSVPLPGQVTTAFSNGERPVRLVSYEHGLCPNQVWIGFTDAYVVSDQEYLITVDVLDTRPPTFYVEEGRRYRIRCRQFCRVDSISPGEEPDVEIRYAPEEVCAGMQSK